MRLKYLLTIVLVSILTLQQARANKPIAIMFRVKGKVSVVFSKQNVRKGKRRLRIYAGTKIITKGKSFAAIKFIDDGSLVRIRSNSTCTIDAKREQNSLAKNVFLEVGTIFSSIKHLKGKFRVTTPTSVASVKGTTFWTKQEFKGATYYFGEEGIVEIKNKRGFALLYPGQTGYVSSPNSKPVVRKTKKGEKPKMEGSGSSIDELEFEFQNKNGQVKTLKFKVKKK